MPRIRTDIVFVEIGQNCGAAHPNALAVGALNVNGFVHMQGYGGVTDVGRTLKITLLLGILKSSNLREGACVVSVHFVNLAMLNLARMKVLRTLNLAMIQGLVLLGLILSFAAMMKVLLSQIMSNAVFAAAVYASIVHASRTHESILWTLAALLAWGTKLLVLYV
jgi:hypothetical protein